MPAGRPVEGNGHSARTISLGTDTLSRFAQLAPGQQLGPICDQLLRDYLDGLAGTQLPALYRRRDDIIARQHDLAIELETVQQRISAMEAAEACDKAAAAENLEQFYRDHANLVDRAVKNLRESRDFSDIGAMRAINAVGVNWATICASRQEESALMRALIPVVLGRVKAPHP